MLDYLKLSFSNFYKMKIINILLTFILLIGFLILLFSIFFYSKLNKKSAKKTIISSTYLRFLEKQEFSPDINTDNWDLHKLRLEKFRRSQYRGLTFFVSSENRIYYLSEKGDKVYC